MKIISKVKRGNYTHIVIECPNCSSDIPAIEESSLREYDCIICGKKIHLDKVEHETIPPETINVKRHGKGFEERGMHVGRPIYYIELGNDGGQPMRMGVLRDAAFTSGLDNILITGDPFSQGKIEQFVHFMSKSEMHVILECDEKTINPGIFRDVSWINLTPTLDKTFNFKNFKTILHSYGKYLQVLYPVTSIGQFADVKKAMADFLHFKNVFVLEPTSNVKELLKQQVLDERIDARVIERVT